MKFKGIAKKKVNAVKQKSKKAIVSLIKKKPHVSKKQGEKPKFPNIKRIIAEPGIWIGMLTVLFLLFLLGIVLLVFKQVQGLRNVLTRRSVVQSELRQWEKIIQTHPGYRDAYMEAAMDAYQLGQWQLVQFYTDKALELDPGYGPAIKLRNSAKIKG